MRSSSTAGGCGECESDASGRSLGGADSCCGGGVGWLAAEPVELTLLLLSSAGFGGDERHDMRAASSRGERGERGDIASSTDAACDTK